MAKINDFLVNGELITLDREPGSQKIRGAKKAGRELTQEPHNDSFPVKKGQKLAHGTVSNEVTIDDDVQVAFVNPTCIITGYNTRYCY
jgi:hypothetical protein